MRVLVTRLSALGDVAMTVPVVCSAARQYPDTEFYVLSRPAMRPLFAHMPGNVRFVEADTSHGLRGLWQTFLRLKPLKFARVIDLHDVLRTKVLRTLFQFTGVKTAHIDKGRSGRKALTRAKHKVLRPLPTSFQRYEDTFRRAGLPVHVSFRSIYGSGQGDATLFAHVTGQLGDGKHWIGLAPFAAHEGKKLPFDTVQALVRQLAARTDCRLFLFGGGKEEAALLAQLADGLPNVLPLAGKLTLEQELALISRLDAMVSMDSANMHLASLVGTPAVSVWGATHPYAGFMGWGQSPDHAVQADLPCRPCSIFGNKPCLRGDYACLAAITPKQIIEQIDRIIRSSKKANED